MRGQNGENSLLTLPELLVTRGMESKPLVFPSPEAPGQTSARSPVLSGSWGRRPWPIGNAAFSGPDNFKKRIHFPNCQGKKKKEKSGQEPFVGTGVWALVFLPLDQPGKTQRPESWMLRRKAFWDSYFHLFCFSQTVWPWASHLTILNLSCFTSLHRKSLGKKWNQVLRYPV